MSVAQLVSIAASVLGAVACVYFAATMLDPNKEDRKVSGVALRIAVQIRWWPRRALPASTPTVGCCQALEGAAALENSFVWTSLSGEFSVSVPLMSRGCYTYGAGSLGT